MHYTNNNTTDYLVRSHNYQKVNEACNGILITRLVQENVTNIIFPMHNTGFDFLLEDEKNEADKSGEEMLCAIQCLENSDKSRFYDLNKRVKNDYVLNKIE